MASDGGDETNYSSGGMADQVVEVFEKRHGELVEEAGALAAESGAGVTVVAVSPRSGGARVSVFPAGGGGCPGRKLSGEITKDKAGRPEKKLAWEVIKKQEDAAGMGAAEVVAFEERVLRVLQRISGAKEEKAGRPGKKLAGEIREKQEEVAAMDAAEVVAFEEQLQALRVRVLHRMKEEEEEEEEEKAAGAAPVKD